MKLNYETCIVGKKCILVPYRPEHVGKYHEWMRDPKLLEATGSEPMTLEEEIENQQSWRDDNSKCTFIVLAREDCLPGDHYIENQIKGDFVVRNLDAMVGDVNLFLSDEEDEDEEDNVLSDPPNASQSECNVALKHSEVDIMIAEKDKQGQGIGWEATCLMMLYGAKMLGIRRFFAKINEDNAASLNLFTKKLGFHQREYIVVFKQYELDLKKETNREMIEALTNAVGELQTFSCPITE
mmetsp:Transcript_16139/g.24382  ORF Transcript_16139/g.24382 Transcript_16139/m.24382 type:complete len:239 (+) Transcript_16139:95-811(+)|eukprot:CAMPEP_0178897468 /NCGR_PEP_ID=MMETSP0786-20121207/1768_1 /TAXON_ID=186022 /ORGANISM="Thalassionema frauenfeldii, Strain CCMP 1798" /LENGTH=238 /DNA_ID=CAMNT_0020568031 /DNA_START=381 /DNA_END=1097 /DNA_ORIENTATION=+